MFGSGLRVEECCTLRIKDIDFVSSTMNVRDGKGGKDRATVLPSRLQAELQVHIMQVAKLHADGRTRGAGLAPLPGALERKHRRRPNLSHGSWCFRLLCVGLGGEAGASLVGIYRALQSSMPFVTLCQKREF